MSGESYTDACYGIKMTHIFPKDDKVTSTVSVEGNLFRMPYKAKICKYGVIPLSATSCVCSTTTTFCLRTLGGTTLATFVPGDVTLATRFATGVTFTSATNAKKDMVIEPGMTEVASSGSVYHFMEYQRVYDGGN